MFLQRFKLETTEPELRLIRRLAELIGERAARLSACGVAAIVKKKNIQAPSISEQTPCFCSDVEFALSLFYLFKSPN
jgi:hexokinase